MLLGTMEVLEDAESKQMIWHEGNTMYYPKGVTDPDYCVVKFTTIREDITVTFIPKILRFHNSFKQTAS